MLSRRRFLGVAAGGLAAATTQRGAAQPSPFETRDIDVEGDPKLGRRFTLTWPKRFRGQKLPLVVLLHGLGETGDPRAGVHAWVDRYGLLTSVTRLMSPPIARTARQPGWTDARLAEVNAALAAQPYGGLAFACPYTPNVAKLPDPKAALDRYAAWLGDVVVPRARREAPVFADAAHTHLGGCSLGGYVGLEVLSRKPDAFGVFGGVQSAFGVQRAVAYADRLAAITRRPMQLLTSEGDPFRDANEALSRELDRRGVAHERRVLPGPHDQPWLREAGTIEMLLFHDRAPR